MAMIDMRGIVDRAASAALDNEEPQREIGGKMQNINEYKRATAETPSPAAPVAPEPSVKDKINPKARYGSRRGEQRIDTAPMTRPLGSFEKGTNHVPKTGVYKLHEGEAVIPKDKNPMKNSDKMKASLSDEDKSKPKKEIKEMVHRKTTNGKHIIVHKHHRPDHHPDEEHAMENMAAVHAHMEKHAGTPNEGEAPDTGANAPTPLTAAPSPMPAAPAAGPSPMPGM